MAVYYYLPPHIHRWELPVLCYHIIRVNYLYPFWGVIFGVILHGFIRQNYHKTSQIVTLFPRYGKLPYFSLNNHILCFQKNSNIHLPQKMPEQFIKNG